MNKHKTPILAFALVTSLFFAWGLANNMTDTLLAAFKKVMSMSDFQTSWIQIAFYGSYFCLAIPAAMIIKATSYKKAILVGLGMFIIGAVLFYPASNTQVYGHFLVALFILAGGLSVLETAANPYILEMGDPATATRRLNLAQSFNPLGSLTGIMLSKVFILSKLNQASAEERAAMPSDELLAIQTSELEAVMQPYVGVAIVLLALWIIIAVTQMPQIHHRDEFGVIRSLRRLFRNKTYRLGVIAQFFYVGAQIGVWSFTIRYVMLELHIYEDDAATYYLAGIISFSLARFLNTYLMKFILPQKLLVFSSTVAVLASLVVIFGSGYLGVIALIVINFCMSLMFPTIYGLALHGLGKDIKIGGSGLIMAILGGAVLTAIQGQVSDMTGSIHLSYFVPLFCFVIVGWFGYRYIK